MFWPDIDDPDYDYEQVCDERPMRIITCRHCKQSGFTWKRTNSGWMMQDHNGILHTCLRDARRIKNREEGLERRKALHELSIVLNGKNPSTDDINRLLQDAARADKQDKYF